MEFNSATDFHAQSILSDEGAKSWDTLKLLSQATARKIDERESVALPYTEIVSTRQIAASSSMRPFDGHELYNSAFDAILSLHISMDSGVNANKFAQDWQHKYDQSDLLATEAGADDAVRSMLKSIGYRYDYFYDRNAINEKAKRSGGELVGIGVRLGLTAKSSENKIGAQSQLVIEDVTENSPADLVGLRAGDVITKIDGNELIGVVLNDAVNKVRGEIHKPLHLSIERMTPSGEIEKIEKDLLRERIRLQNVWTNTFENEIAYVKLHDFDGSAKRDMEQALRRAATQKGLLLDLRGNAGGLLDNAHDIAAMLVEDGPFLVSRARQQNSTAKQEQGFTKYFEYKVQHPDEKNSTGEISTSKRPELLIPHDTPIVVLVDAGTASSAEILSGALQYNRRATIIGMPTEGKGEAQSIISLPFGRKLHVTSMEFSPGRRPNNWTGIIPDVEVAKGSNRSMDEQLDKAKHVLTQLILGEERKNIERARQEELHRKHYKEDGY